MKRLLLMALPFFLLGCEKTDSEDKMLLKLAYDKNYSYPAGFYKHYASWDDIYYLNTNNLLPEYPSTDIQREWIELSTDDKNEALAWLNTLIDNSEWTYVLGKENETEKYFEFEWRYHYEKSYRLFRVHKKSYYQPIYDSWASWEQPHVGYYNAAIEESKVKECIEYLWAAQEFLIHILKK